MLRLLALCLTAAPTEATFLLSVQDVPMARLSVRVDRARYWYASAHFLEEGPASFSKELPLGESLPRPEVLALLTPPASGCQDVLEERTERLEHLCVDERRSALVTGRLNDEAFTARYEHGTLQRIEVGAARWDRVEAGAESTPRGDPNPFADGFELQHDERTVRLEPSLAGVREIRAVKPVGIEGQAGRVRCLPLARAWIAAHRGARVVIGLVIEGGRAFPHAWVRVGSGDVDPSLIPGDEGSPRSYLELPSALAGRTYLELLAGRRAVRGRGPGT